MTAALLKGRGNYICHYHLDRMQGDERALKSRSEIAQLRQIQVFAGISKTGDRGDLAQIPEDAEIWQRVTSTRENCLGQECPRIRDCFVVKARRQAQDADVVVVNHALFMADLVLREEGVTDLLPEADTVIFDEAHQLPDTATRFLGSSVHAPAAGFRPRAGSGGPGLRARSRALERRQPPPGNRRARAAAGLCAAGQAAGPQGDLRGDARGRGIRPGAGGAARGRGHGHQRAGRGRRKASRPDGGGAQRRRDLRAPEALGHAARAGSQADEDGWGRDDQSAETAAGDGLSTPVALLEGAAAAMQWTGPAVRWVEHGLHHVRLHSAPLSVAQAFSKFRKPGQAWIMTSATLSVNGEFEHFTGQLGLDKARTGKWESPFDYPEQALLFVPRGMPEPQSPQFLDRFVQTLLPLLEASPGGTLVLCTTLRAVDKVASLLADAFDDAGHEWPLLKQGDATRRDLLERFCKLPHPVLVGSASFWEGIDLPGDVLTLVAIDKLPFAPPDDPVIEARLRACRAQGGNPFAEYQLPEAAISLKQGAGRLIRTESDWGVLMVGDGRLVEKPYGKRLWRGLPPFARTREAGRGAGVLPAQGRGRLSGAPPAQVLDRPRRQKIPHQRDFLAHA